MKKHYRIKQRCMIGLNLYEPGQEIFIDEEKYSKSLMEPAEAETSAPEEKNTAGIGKRDENRGETGEDIPDENNMEKDAEKKDEAGKDEAGKDESGKDAESDNAAEGENTESENAAGDNDAEEKDITDHKNKMMNTEKRKPFKNPFRKKKKK
jgi:hypothetical protein